MSRRDDESTDPKSSEIEIDSSPDPQDVDEQRASASGATSAKRASNEAPEEEAQEGWEEAQEGWIDLEREARRKLEH